ncbi:MAG: type II secretory pathway pseudopilin PulG [Pirellulaceae bacterium]|jgi:type II secretory pathway pseudopilin PulG
MSTKRRRRGFSLLELLLALALSMIVLAMITSAIYINLEMLDKRQLDVERAQLGRAIMRRIADDLRAAVRYQTPDLSGLDSALESALESTDPSQLGDLAAESGKEVDEDLAAEALDVAATAQPSSVVGIYGNAFQLQVDVSRLPRLDQYDFMLSHDPAKMADIPSDVKTVAYYLAPPSIADEDQLQTLDGREIDETETFVGRGRGLMRRELDRAVSSLALINGDFIRLENSGKLIAPEVNGLQFRYFDGVQWFQEWDSLEMDSLPLAVEVILFLDTEDGPAENGIVNPITNQLADPESYFRMIVAIPVADFVAEEEVDPEDEALGL